MNKAFWINMASLWTKVSNKEEVAKIDLNVQRLFEKSIAVRVEEKSLVDELLDLDDEEDDDDY